jgi:hypothetical protein
VRLRPEVELERNGEEVVLRDGLFGRTLRFAEEPPPRMLLLLNLVEGAGAEAVDKARRLQRGQLRLGRVTLGEARFGCVGSGDCCQSYLFGPLTDEDVARLDKLPVRERFGVDSWIDIQKVGGQEVRFLASRDNRCVFLLDDCRCGIHAEFGVEHKPNLCRFYPIEQFATLDGVQLYDKGHCSEFAVTARSGPSFSQQLDEGLGRLLDASPRLHHPVVLLDAETPVDFGYLQPLLRRVVGELEAPPAGAPEMLRAYHRRTQALKRALETCELEPGAPMSAVEKLLEAPPDLSPSAELQKGAEALEIVAQELLHLLTLPVAREGGIYSGRQAAELIPVLHLVQEVAVHLDEGTPLSDYAREVAAVDIDDPDAGDVLRLSLRHQLFGHDALIDERVLPAQVRLALVQILALWGARLRALADGRKAIVAGDLDSGHMLAVRLSSWTSVQRLLVEREALAPALLEALPALLRV